MATRKKGDGQVQAPTLKEAILKQGQEELKADQAKLHKEIERVKDKWADLSGFQDKLQAGQDQLEKDGKDLVEAKAALDEEKTDMGVRAEAMVATPVQIDPKAKVRLSAVEEAELATLEAQAQNGVRTPSPPDMFRLADLRRRSELE